MNNAPHFSPELPSYAVYDLLSGDPREGAATVSVLGDLAAMAIAGDGPLVRLQTACVPGEARARAAMPADCDCGPQLDAARQQIIEQGAGVLFYIYQDYGHNRADEREYGQCARFLLHYNVSRVRLLTNNPRKVEALEHAGLIVKHEPLVVRRG